MPSYTLHYNDSDSEPYTGSLPEVCDVLSADLHNLAEFHGEGAVTMRDEILSAEGAPVVMYDRASLISALREWDLSERLDIASMNLDASKRAKAPLHVDNPEKLTESLLNALDQYGGMVARVGYVMVNSD